MTNTRARTEVRDCQHPGRPHHHGTRLAYRKDGCGCDPCCAASSAYEKHRLRQRMYGRSPWTDAAPVVKHIATLRANGMGSVTIGRLAGVSAATIDRLSYVIGGQRAKQLRNETAARILAVQPKATALAPAALLPNVGTRRRLEALVAVGWSMKALAFRLGRPSPSLRRTMRSELVLAATARAVTALYDELWDQAPPASTAYKAAAVAKTKRYAVDHGWAPPLAWDDDTIDDPTAQPSGVAPTQHRAADLDDVEHLALAGAGIEEIARRVGTNPRSLERRLFRAGRKDLARQLRARSVRTEAA